MKDARLLKVFIMVLISRMMESAAKSVSLSDEILASLASNDLFRALCSVPGLGPLSVQG